MIILSAPVIFLPCHFSAVVRRLRGPSAKAGRLSPGRRLRDLSLPRRARGNGGTGSELGTWNLEPGTWNLKHVTYIRTNRNAAFDLRSMVSTQFFCCLV